MRAKLIEKIFRDTAYVRMGGTAEEKKVEAPLVDAK